MLPSTSPLIPSFSIHSVNLGISAQRKQNWTTISLHTILFLNASTPNLIIMKVSAPLFLDYNSYFSLNYDNNNIYMAEIIIYKWPKFVQVEDWWQSVVKNIQKCIEYFILLSYSIRSAFAFLVYPCLSVSDKCLCRFVYLCFFFHFPFFWLYIFFC